ncbi:MAG: MBL fold metallo-hydrolase [Lachnospiraceae bacterium]
MIRVDRLVVGMVSTNCYFLINEETKETVVVDPGACAGRIMSFVERNELKPVAVLLTHGHFDHIAAVEELREAFAIPVYACGQEKEMLGDPALNLSIRFTRRPIRMSADIYCKEGDLLELAGMEIRVIETPGHSPGGCCYEIASEDILFSGDTLFFAGIGRTDFTGGSHRQLIRSIMEKLFVLPDQTRVYPGHGEQTTIAYEKENNPYVG